MKSINSSKSTMKPIKSSKNKLNNIIILFLIDIQKEA